MTEIPEHLLKRSRARKSGGAGKPTGSAALTSSSSPQTAPEPARPAALAAATAATPADKPSPDPEPVAPYIEAAGRRRRIPVWAMPVVVALPLWAWAFAGTMQQPDREDPLLTEAAALFTEKGCAGCHGATGGGGTGYQLNGGEALATFPNVIDQMVHVARGSDAIRGTVYGDPNREGGARVAGDLGQMPSQADAGLTQLELELVVFHERTVLSGEDTSSEEYSLYIETLRERIEAGDEHEIDLEALLACANPDFTDGATGSADPEDCTGPGAAEPGA